MKSFFHDIFKYHHHFNQKIADKLIEHADQISRRSIPLFSHTINAHQIWNARILGEVKMGVNEVHTLEKCKQLDKSNFNRTLYILRESELDRMIQYQNSKGKTFQNSIQEILFHIANHATHHKGMIISDMRQKGIEPVVTDYIFYKREEEL